MNNGSCQEFLNINQSILANQRVWDFACNCSDLFYGQRCSLKIDVCKNETCSGNGLCYDNLTKAACDCFLDYSGDQCETQSPKLITIKQIITSVSILAIILICLFYLTFFAMDIFKFFMKTHKLPKKNLKNKTVKKNVPEKIVQCKPVYVNQ